MYLGDFVGTETINHLFTTVQSTGAPTTLAGTPKVRVYKNGSTTESSDLTPTVDFDARTGLNLVAIDLTGDSGFYATGNDFNIVITAGTVNSVSVVGYVVGAFSILHRSPLRPATAGRTLVVDANGLADANVVKLGPTGSGTAQTARDVGASVLLSAGSGAGQLDFTSGVVKANLAQILGTALTETAGLLAGGFKKFFNIATPASTMDVLARVTLTDTVTTYTGNTVQTGDNYARLGAPAGASVSADVAAVKSDTAAVKTATNTGVAPGAASGLAIVGSNMGTVASVTGAVGSVTGAVGSLTTNNDKTGYTLSNTGMDNILDRAAGVETNFTLRQALRLMLSSAVAKLSGAATTTIAIRDINDTKDRITATVDASGNRSAVTTDVS